jgi:hypothetical protein
VRSSRTGGTVKVRLGLPGVNPQVDRSFRRVSLAVSGPLAVVLREAT